MVGDENEFSSDDDGDYENLEQQVNEEVNGAQQLVEQQQATRTCVVCLANEITTLLEPCNRLKFCRDCVDELMIPRLGVSGQPLTLTCPVCRTVITGHRFVYF